MVKLTFIQPDGASQTVEVEPGLTVMEAAKHALGEAIHIGNARKPAH